MIILFMGLPNSGATEIADAVRDRINGLHLDRQRYTNVFGGIAEMEYYYKLGILARTLEQTQDKPIIVDSVFNLEQHRKAFGKADVVVWVDTVENTGSHAWEDPIGFHHKIVNSGDDHEDALPTRAINIVRKFKLFDWKVDTTLMFDKYQPWNDKNSRQYIDALPTNTQVVIGVKHVSGMTEEDKLHYEEVRKDIQNIIPNAKVIKLPNITNVVYTNKSSFIVEKMGDTYG